MKSISSRSLFKLAVVVAVLGLPVAASAASGTFEKSIAVDGNAVVYVSNESGSVTVRGGDVDKVTIRARVKIDRRLTANDPSRAQKIVNGIKRVPPITVEGNKIEISKVARRAYQKYASISYDIEVPRDSDVEIHSVSGDVQVSGVKGDVNARSDKGEVKLADSAPKDEARSAPVL